MSYVSRVIVLVTSNIKTKSDINLFNRETKKKKK